MAKQYGFLVDMRDCYGCKTCSMACKSENDTAPGVLWRKVSEFMTDDPNSMAYLSLGCNHCDDPQCLKICPAEAYSKRADGIVVQDYESCIGCKRCTKACPYQVPVYDAEEDKVSKCNLCAERIDEGLQPRCVESCPAGALQFGDIEELRKQYGADLTRVEAKYKFPDHRTSRPNIVIIPASDKA